jgi:hypothetical protein
MTPGFFHGLAQLLLLIGLEGEFDLPGGMTPLPEDPILAQAAPLECLFYTTWSGKAVPDQKSGNPSEQLLAESEVRQFVAEIERRMTSFASRIKEAEKWADLTDVLNALLKRPGAVFITQAPPNVLSLAQGTSRDLAIESQNMNVGRATNGSPVFQGKMNELPDNVNMRINNLRGGLIVNLGDDAARVKETILKHERTLTAKQVEEVRIAEQTWHRVNFDPLTPPITWGIRGKYLLAGFGADELESLLKRIESAHVPAWLNNTRADLPVERRASLTYVNVRKFVDASASSETPEFRAALNALGFGNVTSLEAVAGLDKDVRVNRLLLKIDGEPQGLFAQAAVKPLSAEDLAPIPADASIALAFRLNADKLLDTILATAEKSDSNARKNILERIEKIVLDYKLKTSIRDELIRSLGDTWCVYNSPSEGGSLLTNAIAVVQVKDSRRLKNVLEQLLTIRQKVPPYILASNPTAQKEVAPVKKFTYAGQDVYFYDPGLSDIPVAPAWCLTEKELIVALYPQGVKAYLSRKDSKPSLARAPELAGSFYAGKGPTQVLFCNSAKLYEDLYPWAPMFNQVALNWMGNSSLNADVSLLPTAKEIAPRLRPGLMTVRQTDAGIEIDGREHVLGAVALSVLPVAAFLPQYYYLQDNALAIATDDMLKWMKTPLQLYAEKHETFPKELTFLIYCPSDMDFEVWGGPFLDDLDVPTDAWGRNFEYQLLDGGYTCTITSAGADGAFNTDDDVFMLVTPAISRKSITQAQLNLLKAPLQLYQQIDGFYPIYLKDLWECPAIVDKVTWGGPYVDGPLTEDAWGRPLRYELSKDCKSCKVVSAGQDGVFDTKDDLSLSVSENKLIKLSKERATRALLELMKPSLLLYKQRHGAFPEMLTFLWFRPADMDAATWQGPYMEGEEIIPDSWGRDFSYELLNNGQACKITSAGDDGAFNTDDDLSLTISK